MYQGTTLVVPKKAPEERAALAPEGTNLSTSPKPQPIQLQYHYDLGDLHEAQQALLRWWWHGQRTRLLIILALFAIVILVLEQSDPKSALAAGFMGSVITILLLVFGAWRKARKPAKNVWTANPILKERFDTEIDEQGIRSRCSIATSDRTWTVFTGYFESAKLFHIQQGPNQFLWIPKRAFGSEQEIQQMRELLRAKLVALKF